MRYFRLHAAYHYLIFVFVIDTEYNIFSRMSKAFPNLVEISGKNIDEAGLRALGTLNGSCLSNVQFDRIGINDGNLLDKAIDAFCKGSPNLKRLCLTDWNVIDSHITDAAVKSVVKYCQQIEKLSLKDWTDVT